MSYLILWQSTEMSIRDLLQWWSGENWKMFSGYELILRSVEDIVDMWVPTNSKQNFNGPWNDCFHNLIWKMHVIFFVPFSYGSYQVFFVFLWNYKLSFPGICSIVPRLWYYLIWIRCACNDCVAWIIIKNFALLLNDLCCGMKIDQCNMLFTL